MDEIVWAREGFRKLQKHLGGTVVESSLHAQTFNSPQILKLSIADKDIKGIRDLIKTLPQSRCVSNFTWPIIGNIAIFVSKRDTHADFTHIYDYTVMDKVVDHPTLAAMDVQTGAKVHVEYTAYMWRGRPPYFVSKNERQAMTTTTYLKELMCKLSKGTVEDDDIVWLGENGASFLADDDNEISNGSEEVQYGCILELTSLKLFARPVPPLPPMPNLSGAR